MGEETLVDEHYMRDLLVNMPKHVAAAMKLGKDIPVDANITSVYICGMGGSAIGGQVVQDYFTYELSTSMYPTVQLGRPRQSPYKIKHITVIRDYLLPATTDENSLVFICSYSGNTEEAISCYRDALKKTNHIIILSSGGRLVQAARRDSKHLIIVPESLPPRTAIPYLFFPLLNVLSYNKLIPNQDKELERVYHTISTTDYSKTARELANTMFGKIPLIYASNKYYVLAYRFKTQCNENAKIPAFTHAFSELNHNELSGLSSTLLSNFTVILLSADNDTKRIQKRMTVTKQIVQKDAKSKGKEAIPFIELHLKGETYLTKIFSGIFLTDWATYYLALQYKVNPTPVTLIEQFKKDMGSFL